MRSHNLSLPAVVSITLQEQWHLYLSVTFQIECEPTRGDLLPWLNSLEPG